MTTNLQIYIEENGERRALALADLQTIAGTVTVQEPTLEPLGYAQATVTTATALPTIPAGATAAVITPRAAIRYRDDGVAPTASAGMYLAADQALPYEVDLAAFRMVAVTGSVEVNVSYYGPAA